MTDLLKDNIESKKWKTVKPFKLNLQQCPYTKLYLLIFIRFAICNDFSFTYYIRFSFDPAHKKSTKVVIKFHVKVMKEVPAAGHGAGVIDDDEAIIENVDDVQSDDEDMTEQERLEAVGNEDGGVSLEEAPTQFQPLSPEQHKIPTSTKNYLVSTSMILYKYCVLSRQIQGRER